MMEWSGFDLLQLESGCSAAGICPKNTATHPMLCASQAEWGSDVKSLEKNCGSCVAAIRSSTTMLTR